MKRQLIYLLLIGYILWGCQTKMKIQPGTQSNNLLKREIKLDIQMQYLLYLPDEYYDSKKSWPVIFFLHGAGERGDDLEKVKIHGPSKLIEQGQSFSFIIVSPQCPENSYWPQEIQVLDALLDDIIDNLKVDKNRIYLTGLSMGGYGAWAWAINDPEKFAAIAPICGGGDEQHAAKLKNVPTWVFHGAKDKVVPLEESQKMVDALEKAGGNVKFTVYPEADHDSWTETYDNSEFYKWLFQQKKEEMK